MPLFDLRGRVAIVTGGNGGIGLGMAEGLAAAGAAIVVVGRNADKNAAATQRLQAMGAIAWAVSADVTQEDQVARLFHEVAQAHDRLDILVNNAGINIRKPPEDYSLAEWHAVMDVNLTSAFLCSRGAHPLMKRSGGGKIIMIGSMTSLLGAPWASTYGASKGGIVQYSRALAAAWAPDNIQVNSVLPGWIDTDLTRASRARAPGMHERIQDRTPAGRWGTPEDLAGIAVFLASAASDFVTGTAIPVDGGYSIQA
ncbi:SDR family NAD(P)-dependent oxidoreductase [Zavarzinia sp. CC-PAN008]|uniref:SDR family NAD(P)-dependent oxidoreductase n=1 Tax=Zavarzinia sp. CC-PAN008 TaxID=3243332 RepID=UPI003F749A18